MSDLIDYQREVKKILEELEEMKTLNSAGDGGLHEAIRAEAEAPTVRDLIKEKARNEEEDRENFLTKK